MSDSYHTKAGYFNSNKICCAPTFASSTLQAQSSCTYRLLRAITSEPPPPLTLFRNVSRLGSFDGATVEALSMRCNPATYPAANSGDTIALALRVELEALRVAVEVMMIIRHVDGSAAGTAGG